MYLTMGTVYILVSGLANVMFKNLGLSNTESAFWSSLFILPYTLKPLWAPLLEMGPGKKFYIVLIQGLLTVSILSSACLIRSIQPDTMIPLYCLLGLSGFLGATQDIAADGIYVTRLSPSQQAKYVGFQSMCWNAGPILANGVLVRASGVWESRTGSWNLSWSYVLFAIAILIFTFSAYHIWVLPSEKKKANPRDPTQPLWTTFGHAFVTFFQKKGVLPMILFAFFFRLGYGFLEKIGPLFMIETRANGGLGLTNQALGDINGTFGTGAFMIGSILAGWWISRQGLKKTLLRLCLCMNVPNMVFLYFSLARPESWSVIASCITVEKFFWGMGVVGLSIYMMQQIAPGPYPTAHYAFATALMGLNMMFTGMISGRLQEWLGYPLFFSGVLLASVPSIAVTLAAPFLHPEKDPSA